MLRLLSWFRAAPERLVFVACAVVPLLLFGAFHVAGNRTPFVPGSTSSGHHQIESQCASCHTPFAGATVQSCLDCHAESLKARNDSHASSKFDDPGKADQLALIDARDCRTCHREHRPEARERGSVSVPAGFCMTCHTQIAEERPSHRGFAPDGCAVAGCHNYHDNRALYEDLLRKHASDPDMAANPRVPLRTPHGAKPTVPRATPDRERGERDEATWATAVAEWRASAHGRAQVSCAACHAPGSAAGDAFVAQVADSVCASCHEGERAGFVAGKHGMRGATGLPPMRPTLARAAMTTQALTSDPPLGCTSCHGAHAFDVRRAAVDACEGCHADEHTQAYRTSAHAAAWRAEVAGRAPPGSGVSCATCHLPRIPTGARAADGHALVQVQHNQNGNLRPTSRMAREVCQPCHGLRFTLNALADPAQNGSNFAVSSRPAPHQIGMDLIQRGEGRREPAK